MGNKETLKMKPKPKSKITPTDGLDANVPTQFGIGVLNANGMVGCNGALRLAEILDVMVMENIKIFGICETKEADGKNIEVDDENFSWLGKPRKTPKGFGANPQAAGFKAVFGGGVGFLIRTDLGKSVKVLKGWDEEEDIMWLRITGSPGNMPLTLGVLYISPDRRDQDKEGVSSLLGKIMKAKEEYSKDSIVIMMGDLNFDQDRDRNHPYTLQWLDLLHETNMEMIDSRASLRGRPTRYPSQQDNNVAPSHLDYLLMDRKWSHIAVNERILDGKNHGVGSDHIPVVADVNWVLIPAKSEKPRWIRVLNLPREGSPETPHKYDAYQRCLKGKLVLWTQEAKQVRALDTCNLTKTQQVETVSKLYDQLTDTILTTAYEVFGEKDVNLNQKPGITPKIRALILKRRTLTADWQDACRKANCSIPRPAQLIEATKRVKSERQHEIRTRLNKEILNQTLKSQTLGLREFAKKANHLLGRAQKRHSGAGEERSFDGGKTWVKGNEQIAQKMEETWKEEGQERRADARFDSQKFDLVKRELQEAIRTEKNAKWNIFRLYEPKMEDNAFKWIKTDDTPDELVAADLGDHIVLENIPAKPRKAEDLQSCDSPPSMKDFLKAKKRLQNKRHKAVGLDKISNVMILEGGDALDQALCAFFTIVWMWGTQPSAWCKSAVSYIPKAKVANAGYFKSYRPISKISCIGKLYAMILFDRMEPLVDSQLSAMQSGFRKKRGTRDNIYALAEALENSQEQLTWTVFVDFKSAFDSVWRDGLWWKMRKYGVEGKLWRTTMEWYRDSQVIIDWDGVSTGWIGINKGVRQGCPLSGLLFALFINDIVDDLNAQNNQLKQSGKPGASLRIGAANIGWEELLALLYADDIILTARDQDGMRLLLSEVIAWSKKWRMVLNTDKTVILSIGSNRLPAGGKDHKVCEMAIGDSTFSQVDQCAYLGKTFNQQLTWNQESSIRIGRAYSYLDTLYKVKTYLGPVKALHVWRQWFTTSVAYGAEAVVYNATIREKLDVLDRAAWKVCLGVDVGTNKAWFEAMLGADHPYTTTLIDIQRLKWWRQLEEDTNKTISSKIWWTMKTLSSATNKHISNASWFNCSCKILTDIGLGDIAHGEESAVESYTASGWANVVKSRLLGRQVEDTIQGLQSSTQRLTVFRETLHRGANGESWGGQGEFYRWLSFGLSGADILWWCKFRGGLFIGKGRDNNWSSEVLCRKCGLAEETMEHVVHYCQTMDTHRSVLLERVLSCIDDPLEALEFDRLGDIGREEQVLVTLGKEKGWETLKDGEFWERVIGYWREFMERFLEG